MYYEIIYNYAQHYITHVITFSILPVYRLTVKHLYTASNTLCLISTMYQASCIT